MSPPFQKREVVVLKRAIGLAWVSGVASLVAVAVSAVRAPPPVPEGLSCWYDREHDLWPNVRVFREDREVRVARRRVHGAYVEAARGFAWFGDTLRTADAPQVRFQGGRLFIDGAPYQQASCALDQTPMLSVDLRDGRFMAAFPGEPPVVVGSYVGPCVAVPPVSDRVLRRVLCRQGELVVSRRLEGLVVEELSGGTSVTWNVPGVPMVGFAAPLPALDGGDGTPLGLRRSNGDFVKLGVDAQRCLPAAPVGGAGLTVDYDCTLVSTGEDSLQRVVAVVTGESLQVSRTYARRPPNVTLTALVGT